MQTPSLDLLILNATCDDWENLSSIRDSVVSAPQGAPVTQSALVLSLLRLVQKGLLEAHEFADGNFLPLSASSVGANALAKLWFFITPEGRRVLDENTSFFE